MISQAALEQYDERLDAVRLRAIARRCDLAEREGLAVQAALAEHPVMRFVKHLPFEPAAYPAKEYLKDDLQETPGDDYLVWCPPAHDRSRPREKHCGFLRAADGSLVHSRCPEDAAHYCKGKRFHCWSLRCPVCANDTALRRGIDIQRRLLQYRALKRKQGSDPGPVGHWVVSPPQEIAKRLMQTRTGYDLLVRRTDDALAACGARAGFTVFHPWRQGPEEWRLAPHFHVLLYGWIDTARFRRDNPGWLVKKVHAREQVRSIGQTAAYLMTHMGLGLSERDPDGVDWDLKVLDRFVPGLRSPGADFTEKDWQEAAEGKGRICGSFDGVDWTEWTMDELSREVRTRYWGGVARGEIVEVARWRQYKVRVCRECGTPLRTYEGCCDTAGSLVRYIRDCPVVCFAHHAQLVRAVFLRYKDRLRAGDTDLETLARAVPVLVSDLELGLPETPDLVLSGPFAEPDAYFLQRQQAAFGRFAEDPAV